MSAAAEKAAGGSLLTRLRRGLGFSAAGLSLGLGGGEKLGRILDESRLRSLEKMLLQADVGPLAARRILAALRERRFSAAEAELQGGELDAKLRAVLAQGIADELRPHARRLEIDPAHRPHVILASGVNGCGKTTSLGKLAALLRRQGRSVLLAAADSFRAAAIDQLRVWAQRAGAGVEAGAVGEDPAAIAYRALRRAQAEGVDVLLVDTAGRLQNRRDLMAETEKMLRVLRKLDASAPHDSLLVLDAATGQNALAQAQAFGGAAEITGLIAAKLDGAAKGGVLLALCAQTGLPIYYVGLGEGLDDLFPFDPDEFAQALTMQPPT